MRPENGMGLVHPKMHPHTKFVIPTTKNMRYAPDTIILERSEVKVSDQKIVRDIPPSQDTSTHQICDSYLKEYRRYALDTMQILESRSEVKVT